MDEPAAPTHPQRQRPLGHLGAITPDYLLVYQLLWTPQKAADSLGSDELLAHVPNRVQIA